MPCPFRSVYFARGVPCPKQVPARFPAKTEASDACGLGVLWRPQLLLHGRPGTSSSAVSQAAAGSQTVASESC